MRFQTKLLIAFAVSFALSIGAMLILALQSERKLVERMEKNISDIAQSVHFSTQRLTAEKGADRDALDHFISEAMQNKAVRDIIIVNADSQVVASTDTRAVGKHHNLTGHEMILRAQFGAPDSAGPHYHYVVNIPIQRDDGKVIGMVQTSIVGDRFGVLLRRYMRTNMVVAGAAFIVVFVAFSVLLSQLWRPLARLSAAADQIASGDLSIQLTSKSRDEVGKLTESFNVMAKKLQEQKGLEDKLRSMERRAILSETAATLAHEIRNPLNLINLTADHIGTQFKPPDPALDQAYQDLITSLKAEVKHLNQMVNEFLAIGKPIKIVRTKFRFDNLMEQVGLLVRQHLVDKNINLRTEIPAGLTIDADLEQMRLVVLNLLLNAVQVSQPFGIITITATAETGRCRITVTDSGPGIDPGDLERIFEPYFTKRQDGTGLGLALARRIVEEHNGRIVASNTGAGACFEISLPQDA